MVETRESGPPIPRVPQRLFTVNEHGQQVSIRFMAVDINDFSLEALYVPVPATALPHGFFSILSLIHFPFVSSNVLI